VYRLAEVSNSIIDQCVAQGVPFAREYGGLLDNRSFGGAQVFRTFYAKGQTGQQLLLGAYSALSRQAHKGSVKIYTRHEMLDLVLIKDDEGVEAILNKSPLCKGCWTSTEDCFFTCGCSVNRDFRECCLKKSIKHCKASFSDFFIVTYSL
jgi:aspartate oxidase